MPVPVPSDLVMLLLGERVSAGESPWWQAMAALELVALTGETRRIHPVLGRGPARGRSGRGRGHRSAAGPDPVAVGPPWGSVADRLGSGDQAVHRVFPTWSPGGRPPGCGR